MEDKIQNIINIAKGEFKLDNSSIHGTSHWEEVEKNCLMLSHQPNVDLIVVRLFAYLHDCKRQDDDEDPEHGDRSADFVTKLCVDGELDFLTKTQQMELWTACKYHHKGVTSSNITIGVCYDSDRIELLRCGTVPRPDLMSTPVGIRIAEKMNLI